MGRGSDTRGRILAAAYDLFYRNGFARVGIERVAERAGITKKSFYYHFATKDELLAAVLEQHHRHALDRIAGWALRLDGGLDEFLESLFGNLAGWAARPRWEGAGFTRLVMELADRPGHPARAIARRHKAAVEAWLAGELRRRGVAAEVERAREIVLLVEGALTLMLVHGSAEYARAAAAAARELIRSRRHARTRRSKPSAREDERSPRTGLRA
jgi:AcrR family transcriptional regulator